MPALLFDKVAADAGAPYELLSASEAGDAARVGSLLASRADPNERDDHGWSPVIMAAKEGHVEVLRTLIASGSMVNPPDISHTAIRGAAIAGHAACIGMLIEAQAAVNQVSAGGRTALMGAAMNGHATALALLLEHGAEAGAVNDFGETAMELGRAKGHEQVIAALDCGTTSPCT